MTNRRFKVVLDPGHGGHDPGAVGPTGLKEKDVTLAVARRAASLLAPLVDVKLTRDTDRDFSPVGKPFSSDIDIGHRARQLVNKSGADVCVSIHCNSFASGSGANGVETWYNNSQSQTLAAAIQQRLVVHTGRRDRGVKTGTFGMIRIPTMPSCLPELPFISNPQEEVLLRDPAFQDKCARAIVDGVLEFLGVTGRLQQTPQTPPPEDASWQTGMKLTVNGRPTRVPLRIMDGRTQALLDGNWIQLRTLAQLLGAAVDWDPVTQTVKFLIKGDE